MNAILSPFIVIALLPVASARIGDVCRSLH